MARPKGNPPDHTSYRGWLIDRAHDDEIYAIEVTRPGHPEISFRVADLLSLLNVHRRAHLRIDAIMLARTDLAETLPAVDAQPDYPAADSAERSYASRVDDLLDSLNPPQWPLRFPSHHDLARPVARRA